MKNEDAPAFPQTFDSWSGCVAPAPPVPSGMFLRDYFAAHAPFGESFLLAARVNHADPKLALQEFAEWSYLYADAMLTEREKVTGAR